jgi:hypothetical protein
MKIRISFYTCNYLLRWRIVCWHPRKFLKFRCNIFNLLAAADIYIYIFSECQSLYAYALQVRAQPVNLAWREPDAGSLISIVQVQHCKRILATTRPQQSFMEAAFLPTDVYSETTSGPQAFHTPIRPLVTGYSREQVQVVPSALYQHF